jgi:hypothetical protein
MIQATARITKAGEDIIEFQVGKLGNHLLGSEACREQIENVHDPDAHAADARTTAALLGVHGDSIRKFGHWNTTRPPEYPPLRKAGPEKR